MSLNKILTQLAQLIILASLSTWANAQTNGFVWQGFDHEWQRFVVFPNEGRIPHRISRFASYITSDPITPASKGTPTGKITFAQNTGVDGNYMRPKGYFTPFQAKHINLHQGRHRFQWSDNIINSDIPVAESTITHNLTHTIPSTPETPLHQINAIAVLNGIDLAVNCDNSKQPESLPCNSNGLWPYVFYVGFKECTANESPSEEYVLNCPLHVKLHRGWTPNLGGFQLPPIFSEIKPLNHRLDITLTVHYSVIYGDPVNFYHQTVPDLVATQSLHNPLPIKATHIQQWDGPLTPEQITTAITGFGFKLTEPVTLEKHWQMLGSDTRQRGRYLAKLAFNTKNPELNHQQLLSFDYEMHLWSPITVVNSLVTTTLNTAVLAFRQATQNHSQQKATGRLCINSTEQAPAFSKWRHCDLNYWWARWLYGSPRSTHTLNITAN